MKSNELDRVIRQFRRTYETNVSNGSQEIRVSDLLEADRKDWERRDGELHPSSFPFCGLRYAYEYFNRDEDPVINLDFGRDYFLNAGHVFHAALQKWMGNSGEMLGDWRCEACGTMHKFKARPGKCRKCGGQHLEYRELGGAWGKHVHWHTDGLWKSKKIWVVDYKSTSTYAIEQHRKTKQVFPYISNRFQIETYIPLIEDTYNIEIAGWLLVYAARDNPNHMFKVEVVGGAVDEDRRAQLKERLHTADTDYGIARKVKEQPIKVFKRLERTKLCEDRDFYDHFVHDKYNPCPLHKVCFGSKLHAKLHKGIDA
jgi:hypothetical protein